MLTPMTSVAVGAVANIRQIGLVMTASLRVASSLTGYFVTLQSAFTVYTGVH